MKEFGPKRYYNWIFVHETAAEEDIIQLFNPRSGQYPPRTEKERQDWPVCTSEGLLADHVIIFDDTMDLADFAIIMGRFPSRTQARKNGWLRPVPTGWSTFKISGVNMEVYKTTDDRRAFR